MINSGWASANRAIYISSNSKTMPIAILIILLDAPPFHFSPPLIPDWAKTMHHQSFFYVSLQYFFLLRHWGICIFIMAAAVTNVGLKCFSFGLKLRIEMKSNYSTLV